MQAVAKPAYLSDYLCYALLRVAGCCAPGGVRVVSTGANVAGFRFVGFTKFLQSVGG